MKKEKSKRREGRKWRREKNDDKKKGRERKEKNGEGF